MSKLMLSVHKLRQARKQPMWMLVASADAVSVIPVLQSVLGGQERVLRASVCQERVGRALEQLRQDGEDLKQSPKDYIANWVSSGWLNRRIIGDESEESYELSAAAQSALRWSEEISQPTRAATESRLSIVIEGAFDLATDSNPDPQIRLAEELKKRDEIELRIQALRSGESVVLDEQRAKERLIDLVSYAKSINGDFGSLCEIHNSIHRTFRRKLIEGGQSRHDILEAVFASIEMLEDTDEGKSFMLFWRLLTDPVKLETLEQAIEEILKRDFSKVLSNEERKFLTHLSDNLINGASGVHEIIFELSKDLRVFVQSKEYKEHQRIRDLIANAHKVALKVGEVCKANADTGFELGMPIVNMGSISQGSLHLPASAIVIGPMGEAEDSKITLKEISDKILAAEIDFPTLTANIRDALKKRDFVSVSELSQQYPMNQGLGSLLGYMQLAVKHGDETFGRTNRVSWKDPAGNTKTVTITETNFTREVSHELL